MPNQYTRFKTTDLANQLTDSTTDTLFQTFVWTILTHHSPLTNHARLSQILSYPVITSGEFAHKDSFKNLTGTDDESNHLWSSLSLERRITDIIPPTFLWHTYEDICVPVENTLMYAAGLRRVGVPFELHIFEHLAYALLTQSRAR